MQVPFPFLLLPLTKEEELRRQLLVPRLERARQFDEYCWFDRTSAVRPLETTRMKGMLETYPFGL